MINLIPNLKTFIKEMHEKDGKIILRLRKEVGADPDGTQYFRKRK